MLPPIRDVDIRIDSQGRWFHEGGEIRRQALVRLFASVLQCDDEGVFWLVTPAERCMIRVDDAPFIVTSLEVVGSGKTRQLCFTTSLGERVVAGPAHPLRIQHDGKNDEPRPYLMIRDRLEGLVSRPVFYELAALAEPGPEARQGVWSDGVFYALD